MKSNNKFNQTTHQKNLLELKDLIKQKEMSKNLTYKDKFSFTWLENYHLEKVANELLFGVRIIKFTFATHLQKKSLSLFLLS